MTSKADLEEAIRKRIEKLDDSSESKQKTDEKPEPPQESINDPESSPNSDEGVGTDKQVKRARKAKQKRLKGYVNTGGKKRGK